MNQPYAWLMRRGECYPETGEKKRGDSEWALLDLSSGFKFSEVKVQIIKSAAV